jgi:dGTPase
VDDLPRQEIEVLGDTGSDRIDTLVHDLVEHSAAAGEIVQGEEVGTAMSRLREFMFDRVYLAPDARREHARIETVVRAVFEHYVEHPPPGIEGATAAERVTDWLAGMTDRYCIREFEALTVPRSFA